MQLVTTTRRSASPSVTSAVPVPASRVRRPRRGAAADQCRRKPAVNVARNAAPSELSAAKLEQMEDALIESLLDVHPNHDRAINRLLHDVDRAERDGRGGVCLPVSVSAPENAPGRLLRIEELLVAVVIGRHPKQPQSLDRLLRHLDERDQKEEQAAGTDRAGWDNDFDGLG